MRYVSIDLETTGLDPRLDQVLQVALVLEDAAHPEVPVEQLPAFECLVLRDRYEGSPFALALNHEILRALAGPFKRGDATNTLGRQLVTTELRGRRIEVLSDAAWEKEAARWLDAFGVTAKSRITVAGKNAAGFDLRFLVDGGPLTPLFHHRVLDPGSVFFDERAACLPSLDDLKKALGLGTVSHDALDDARDVIRVLRASYDVALPGSGP